MEDLSGRSIGDFDVIEPIGEGGFAVVYLARQRSLGRDVALKVLNPTLARSADAARRFEREGRSAAALEHPNIVPVYAAGEQDGVVFLAMRFIRGGSLEELLDSERRLAPDRTLEIIQPVASALGVAHANGVIHRDVKPANILLEDRTTYLTDFGIAVAAYKAGQYTQGGIGTARYMSPEQAQGLPSIGPPSDLYSLACTTFHCLVGTEPFVRATDLASILAHLNDPVPPTGMGALDAFFQRAMHKDAAVRPQSAAEFSDGLRRAVGGDSGDPRPLPAVTLQPPDRDAGPRQPGGGGSSDHATPSSGPTPTPVPTPTPSPTPVPGATPVPGPGPGPQAPPSPVGAPPPQPSPSPFGQGSAAGPSSDSGRRTILLLVPLLLIVIAVGGFLLLSGGDTDDAGDVPEVAADGTDATSSPEGQAAETVPPAQDDSGGEDADADPGALDGQGLEESAGDGAEGGLTQGQQDSGLGGPADGDIAFVRIMPVDGGEQFDLFLLPDDGSGVRQLTDDPELDGSPVWLPDGRTIIFPRGIPGQDLGLHSLDVTDPAALPVRLTGGPFDADPEINAAGDMIVFVRPGPAGGLDIYVYDLASGQERRVGGTPGDDLRPAFRPGGSTISFHTRVGDSNDVLEMDLQTGAVSPLVADPGVDEARAIWLDGDALLYESGDQIMRWTQDSGAGPFPLPQAVAGQPRVSPSGEHLLYRTFLRDVSTLAIHSFADDETVLLETGVSAQDAGWGPARS